LYREVAPARGLSVAFLWPFTQVIAATALLLDEDTLATLVHDGLAKYLDTRPAPAYSSVVVPPYGSGGARYYDDNAWVGLTLLRAHRILRDPSLVPVVRRVFDFVVTGWDDDRTHPYPGGVFWTEDRANRDRNTVSNAPNAELGLELYALTGDSSYRDWARRMHDWIDAVLRDPSDGLYWDHIALSGSIDTTKWTYNQGSVIAVKLRMGDTVTAEAIARAALRHFDRVGYRRQDPAFNAIFFDRLVELTQRSNDGALRADAYGAIERYADDAWNRYRSERDLFASDRRRTRLIDQVALVQIEMLLAGARSNEL
jgi:hypothetical protein